MKVYDIVAFVIIACCLVAVPVGCYAGYKRFQIWIHTDDYVAQIVHELRGIREALEKK